MRRNLTRMDLINAATNAQCYIKQLRGLICLVDDKYSQVDSEEAWQIGALLTLAHLASQELEPAVLSRAQEPEK